MTRPITEACGGLQADTRWQATYDRFPRVEGTDSRVARRRTLEGKLDDGTEEMILHFGLLRAALSDCERVRIPLHRLWLWA